MELTIFWQTVKIMMTVFTAVLVPVYIKYYGIQNFLWFSDIAHFLTITALWLNSIFIMSIAATVAIFLELLWIFDFLITLIFKVNLIRLADYMFDPTYNLPLRLLSLFHIINPLIWLSFLNQYGYDPLSLYCAIFLFWLILYFTYFFTDQIKNINWVFQPTIKNWKISQTAWLLLLSINVPLLVFLPTNYLFKLAFTKIT